MNPDIKAWDELNETDRLIIQSLSRGNYKKEGFERFQRLGGHVEKDHYNRRVGEMAREKPPKLIAPPSRKGRGYRILYTPTSEIQAYLDLADKKSAELMKDDFRPLSLSEESVMTIVKPHLEAMGIKSAESIERIKSQIEAEIHANKDAEKVQRPDEFLDWTIEKIGTTLDAIRKNDAWKKEQRIKAICEKNIKPLIYDLGELKSRGHDFKMPWDYFEDEHPPSPNLRGFIAFPGEGTVVEHKGQIVKVIGVRFKK